MGTAVSPRNTSRDLWEQHDWPVGAPEAYPTAIWYGSSGEIRCPDAREMTDIEGGLLALSWTTDGDID